MPGNEIGTHLVVSTDRRTPAKCIRATHSALAGISRSVSGVILKRVTEWVTVVKPGGEHCLRHC